MDYTKNYKYMYFCCGVVVILASVWLFIGNFINYRLLERERKKAEIYKQTETEDPDRGQERKEADGETPANQELVAKGPNDEQSVQHETNI